MKGAGSDPLANLKGYLVRKEATNAHPGDADVDNSHFGTSVCQEDAGKHHFEILPLMTSLDLLAFLL